MSELAIGTRKRLSRIRRRAIAEVKQAFSKGLISAHKADDLLHLPKRQQAQKLAVILADRKTRERTAHVAATTINEYLANHPGKVDLMELSRQIRAAIA